MTMTIEVRERPILFSGEMVRAILEGRKTQTRRVMKVADNVEIANVDRWHIGTYGTNYGGKPFGVPHGFVPLNKYGGIATKAFHDHHVLCPYGEPGDRLWVRESFLPDPPQNGDWDYYAYTDGVLHNFNAIPEKYRSPRHVLHKATRESDFKELKWLPSIHMPRWASRITLEITKVRVERVQEISEGDAITEGVLFRTCNGRGKQISDKWARELFARLWDRINAKRGFGWEVNPWVWVIEFRRV